MFKMSKNMTNAQFAGEHYYGLGTVSNVVYYTIFERQSYLLAIA